MQLHKDWYSRQQSDRSYILVIFKRCVHINPNIQFSFMHSLGFPLVCMQSLGPLRFMVLDLWTHTLLLQRARMRSAVIALRPGQEVVGVKYVSLLSAVLSPHRSKIRVPAVLSPLAPLRMRETASAKFEFLRRHFVSAYSYVPCLGNTIDLSLHN